MSIEVRFWVSNVAIEESDEIWWYKPDYPEEYIELVRAEDYESQRRELENLKSLIRGIHHNIEQVMK